jgi:hypothetical protein
MFCDGGHYFTGFFWPAMQAAVAPRALEVVTPPADPDVVIFSVEGGAHRAYPEARRVLIVGEPQFDPSLMQWAHMTIHCAKDVPGAEYVPFWAEAFGERRKNVPEDLFKVPARVEAALARKTEFCAFLYSRPAAERDYLFDLVSTYKPVTALGRSKTTSHEVWSNADRHVYTANETYNDLAVQKYAPFKFVIAGENSRRVGYVTEKIVNAMLAHAIPIYVGAEDISEHFHPGSFIDAATMTAEALLAEVARLENALRLEGLEVADVEIVNADARQQTIVSIRVQVAPLGEDLLRLLENLHVWYDVLN